MSQILNAVIDCATIKIERGFVLDSWVHLDMLDGGHQGYGGYALGGTPGTGVGRPEGLNYAGIWIMGILRAADVEDWFHLKGRAVRIRKDTDRRSDLITAIGHIVREDRWFDASAAFAQKEACDGRV